jgi:two-component system OmpR family sensor kinase
LVEHKPGGTIIIFMNRLFLRFFLLVMFSITLASLMIYILISWFFGDPQEQNAARQAAPQIYLLEQYIDKAGPDEWLVRLNKVREVSRIKLDLIPLQQALGQLSPAQQNALKNGTVVIDARNKAFFRRVDLSGDKYIGSDDDVIHAQDLPIDLWLSMKMEALRYLIVAIVLLVPIAFWSRSHWRDLQALASVADKFGRGTLSVRADIVKSASIYPLAEHMNQMAARIETLLEAQKSLMHSVSHELRTPIARLEFGLELLRKLAKDNAIGDRIDALQEDTAELNALVNELLSMVKLNAQTDYVPEIFAIDVTIKNCIRGLMHEISVRDQSIEFNDSSILAYGDERMLARAISNLLKNASKYSHSKIRLSASKSDHGWIKIAVDDDGPGIPMNERMRIFEPFYRLDRSRDRGTGGFGLGLSIARQAILLHGGTLSICDSSLGGARFVIDLPGQK